MQLRTQCLSGSFSLEPWVWRVRGFSTHSLWSRWRGAFKVRAAWEGLSRISSASLDWENKPLSAQICSSVGDEGQLNSKILTGKESAVRGSDKRQESLFHQWMIYNINPICWMDSNRGRHCTASWYTHSPYKGKVITSKPHMKIIPRMWSLYFKFIDHCVKVNLHNVECKLTGTSLQIIHQTWLLKAQIFRRVTRTWLQCHPVLSLELSVTELHFRSTSDFWRLRRWRAVWDLCDTIQSLKTKLMHEEPQHKKSRTFSCFSWRSMRTVLWPLSTTLKWGLSDGFILMSHFPILYRLVGSELLIRTAVGLPGSETFLWLVFVLLQQDTCFVF